MSDEILVKANDVSKKFCRSLNRSIGYGLQDVTRDVLGLDSKLGELRKDEFWAVDGVSFEVKRGEALGIIGPNGAGKTTILKMLNGIFMPDKGRIEVKNKVGVLIEVGAGFHPQLSGRENIYVNGAILGMAKREIDIKFDSIVDFAGIGDFLDAPVKFYSSGMYVRLGFAIAIHSEPEVLLIDEVLAVGDTAFRHKCYRKMDELRKKDIAIVLISHDLFAVGKFCNKGMFLNHGKIESEGEIYKVIQDYQSAIASQPERYGRFEVVEGERRPASKEVEIKNVKFLDSRGEEKNKFNFGEALNINIEYKAKKIIQRPNFEISIWNSDDIRICTFATFVDDVRIDSLNYEGTIECIFENMPLLPDRYSIIVTIYDETCTIPYDWWRFDTRPDLTFSIFPNQISAKMAQYSSICYFRGKWKVDGIDR